MVCCDFSWFVFFSVFFLKRHLVRPPPLYISKQVIIPPPAREDKSSARCLIPFDSIEIEAFTIIVIKKQRRGGTE